MTPDLSAPAPAAPSPPARSRPPIRVLELRSVAGVGGGPDKTIIAGALRSNASIAVTVCYLCNANDPPVAAGQQAVALGLDYIEIRERHSLAPSIWPAIRRVVRSRQIDIVHAHDYKTDLLAYMLGRAERVLPLATAHGWTGHLWRERAFYYPADKRLLARFPRIVAVSGEIRLALVAVGGDEKRIDVVLNGIDPERFQRDPRRRAPARTAFGLHDEDVAIGAVGRLEPQKRFDLLIEAFAVLVREQPASKLLIAGEGSLERKLKEQITRLGLDASCRLVGQADVTSFHHALDLFVQSSAYEGTPNVVLEAMALGTPIVATDVGGTAELMFDGMHGLLIEPGNARLLLEAMRRAFADPAAALSRAAAARRRIETDLSFDQRMRKLEGIYQELYESRRPS